jgi:hypothetical protein
MMISSPQSAINIPDPNDKIRHRQPVGNHQQKMNSVPINGVSPYWQPGTLLSMCLPMTKGQWAGEYGLIYDMIREEGGCYAAILLENGDDLGLIHLDMLPVYFVPLPIAPARYTYSSSGQLLVDFDQGYFDTHFMAAATYVDGL